MAIFDTIITLPIANDTLVDGSEDEHPFEL
jgi:hypothetical protein